MTYSGTLMLVICGATARLLHGTSAVWAAFVMPALLVALSLTLTRGAWVGVAVGVAVIFLSKDFRLLALIPIVVVTGVLLAPQALTDRVYSIFDRNDLTSRDRVAMLQAGAAMVKDYPLMGVGPDQIERAYPNYRVADAVKPTNPHLHNVPMQIAAERGLPALAAWLWFVVVAAMACSSCSRRRGTRASPPPPLAALPPCSPRPHRVQLRRLRIPDVAAGDDHAAVCRQPRWGPALVKVSVPRDRLGARAQLIDRFASRRITVVGDVMLDRFMIGRVSRISPEAPVPVVVFEMKSQARRRRQCRPQPPGAGRRRRSDWRGWQR